MDDEHEVVFAERSAVLHVIALLLAGFDPDAVLEFVRFPHEDGDDG